MPTQIFHSVVVTGIGEDDFDDASPPQIILAHRKATSLFDADLVTLLTPVGHNFVQSFCILPSGSGQGRPEQMRHAEAVAEFCAWLAGTDLNYIACECHEGTQTWRVIGSDMCDAHEVPADIYPHLTMGMEAVAARLHSLTVERDRVPQLWHLWLCAEASGSERPIGHGDERTMRESMQKHADSGRDVWLVSPDGAKHLPAQNAAMLELLEAQHAFVEAIRSAPGVVKLPAGAGKAVSHAAQELALLVMSDCGLSTTDHGHALLHCIAERVQAVMNAAALGEREACAALAVQWGSARLDDHGGHALRNFAQAVRNGERADPVRYPDTSRVEANQ